LENNVVRVEYMVLKGYPGVYPEWILT
jgi:hypothetical protein